MRLAVAVLSIASLGPLVPACSGGGGKAIDAAVGDGDGGTTDAATDAPVAIDAGGDALTAGCTPRSGTTIALGVALHIVIAFSWTTVYYLVSRTVPAIRAFASSNGGSLVTGMVFGACMWLGMDYVVIPLSQARFTPPSNWQFWLQLGWHIVGLGPPLVRILR